MGILDLFKGSGGSSSSSKKMSSGQVPGKKQADPTEAVSSIRETLEILQKKEEEIERKIQIEHNKAKASAATNKNAALVALKKKKALETQLAGTRANIMRMEEQALQLETVALNVETTFALKKSLEAQKVIQSKVTVEDMETIVDDLRDFQDRQKEFESVMQSLENVEHEEEIEDELNRLIEEDLIEQMPTVSISEKEPPRRVVVSAAAAAPTAAKASKSVEPAATPEEEELEMLRKSLAL